MFMQQNYIILKRPLTDQEIDLVFKEIKTTPNITGYTKNEWKGFQDIFVAEKDGKLIGLSLLKVLDEDWSELAALYILPTFRHKGIGRRLFYKSIEYLKTKNKNIYTVSRNPLVIDLMRTNQFKIIGFSSLPRAIKVHIFKHSMSFYRFKEYIRKVFVYKSKDKWVYSIRTVQS